MARDRLCLLEAMMSEMNFLQSTQTSIEAQSSVSSEGSSNSSWDFREPCLENLDIVFCRPWRWELPEDLSPFEAGAGAGVAADIDEAFPAALNRAAFKLGDGDASGGTAAVDGPGETDSACPTVAMACTLSLGRVLVEPME